MEHQQASKSQQAADTSSNNLKNLIQSNGQPAASWAKVYGNGSVLKNTAKAETNKSDPVVITSTLSSVKKNSALPNTHVQPQTQTNNKPELLMKPPIRDGKSWFNHDLINPFVID